MNAQTNHSPPPFFQALLEARAPMDYLQMRLVARGLRLLGEKGLGQPVWVLPGMGTVDYHTRPLRRLLESSGYKVFRWERGPNFGFLPGIKEAMHIRLREMHQQGEGKRVTLIGWSLGGVMARTLAAEAPDLVERVIMLASPIHGMQTSTRVGWLYHGVRAMRGVAKSSSNRIPRLTRVAVPITSVVCRWDGIVNWWDCLEFESVQPENWMVPGTHLALCANPWVAWLILERLASGANGAFFTVPKGLSHFFREVSGEVDMAYRSPTEKKII
ncbi:MAG: alpha/beta hydrolase family protein [Myxococcota bacterium]|nr:alpha/beta hydrolase family protein [Myxococcota bacterium]